MNSRISSFMSDFLLAASDYERLDETVHDFLDNGSPARIDEFSHRISDSLVNAKKSITAAVASGSDVTLTDELPEDIRDDVRFALKMSVHWMERVKLLESMLRALVMETDADYIELMVRARRNLAMMGIQEDFSDDESEEGDEEESEDESEEEEDAEDDYPDDEPFEPRIEHNIDDKPVPEEDDEPLEVFPESEPDFIHIGELPREPRIVNGIEDDTLVPEEIHGETPEPIEEPATDYHEEPVQRILPPTQENLVPTPQPTASEGQPLTKEDVAGIVLDVITDLLRPEQTTQPQRIDIDEPGEEEEPKPAPRKKPSARKTSGKKTTTRKTTGRKTSGKKSPVDKVLDILKKDDEEGSE